MKRKGTEFPTINQFFFIKTRKSKIIYFFIALTVVLSLRMLENALHEFSHASVVFFVGGALRENPFLITPFGGYTRWQDVPLTWLPLVNIAGTLFSTIVMISIFVPIFIHSKNKLVRWTAYWGGFVIPVNALFYWLIPPFIADAMHFDPVAFAVNLNIEPTWIIGVVTMIPFSFLLYFLYYSTNRLNHEILQDKSLFHLKCLVFYYAISMFFPTISYLNLLDQFKWW